jgi:hypothetical protein
VTLAFISVGDPSLFVQIGNFVYGVEHAGLLYLSGTYGATVAANDRDYLPIAGKTGAAVFT